MNMKNRGFIETAALIGIGIAVIASVGIATLFKSEPAPVIYELPDEPEETLGAFNPVGGQNYFLFGGGVGASDTSITLTDFDTPVSGYDLSMDNFGDIGYLTLEPGSATRQEFVSFTGVTQNADDTATLTGVTRGLSPVSPYTASSTLQKAHPGGSIAVLSNPPQFYEEFGKLSNDETITGDWLVPAPANPTSIVNRNYVDAIVFGGIGGASETATGTVEIATSIEAASSTLNGTSGRLALPASIATSTYNAATADLKVVVTQNDGTIDSNFLPNTIAKNITFTGESTFNGTTTISGEEIGAKQVIAGATINGATLPVPVYQNKTDNEFYAVDANATTTFKYLGFAVSNGTDGNVMDVQFSGIVSGFTGLSEGEKYYVQDTIGTIGKNTGTAEILVGIDIYETELIIQKGKRYANGELTLGTTVSNQALTIGFRPSRIRIVAHYDSGGNPGNQSQVNIAWSHGVTSIADVYGDPGTGGGAGNGGLLRSSTSNYITIGVASVTDTGFTITLVETDTFAGGGRLLWEAEGEL